MTMLDFNRFSHSRQYTFVEGALLHSSSEYLPGNRKNFSTNSLPIYPNPHSRTVDSPLLLEDADRLTEEEWSRGRSLIVDAAIVASEAEATELAAAVLGGVE